MSQTLEHLEESLVAEQVEQVVNLLVPWVVRVILQLSSCPEAILHLSGGAEVRPPPAGAGAENLCPAVAGADHPAEVGSWGEDGGA